MDTPPITLRRIDPKRNMARYYILATQSTLWGSYAVVRTYGRMGTWGREHQEDFPTRGEAEVHRMRLAAAKLRRGYRPISSRARG